MLLEFLIFFPGVVLHELSHYLSCVLLRVKVYRVKLYGLDEAYVEHEIPNSRRMVVITLVPFLLNNLLSLFVICLFFTTSLFWYRVLFVWLSFSFTYFSVPSDDDLKNSFRVMKRSFAKKMRGSVFAKIFWLLVFPVFYLIVAFLLQIIKLFSFKVVRVVLYVFMFVVFYLYFSGSFSLPLFQAQDFLRGMF